MSELFFKNALNKLRLGKMDAKEHDVFSAVLLEIIRKKKSKIEISFLELKTMTGMAYRGEKRLIDTIDKMVDKFHQARHRIEKDGVITYFNMLDETTIDTNEKKVKFEIKEKFMKYLIFDFKEGDYTRLDFETLVSLKSKYSKIAYKLIKQWETTGIQEFTITDFKEEFEISEKYTMSNIDKKVLNVIEKELIEIIKGFKIEKIKSGRKVTKIIFTWQRIERKKNSFKKQQETVQGTGTGSKKLYNKELAAEKTIKVEKEIEGLKTEERLAEIVKTNLSSKVVEETVRRVTSNEYEMMYQDYLKANKVEASLFARKGFDIMNKGKYEIIKENKKAL